MSLDGSLVIDDDDDERNVQGDATHLNPTVTGCIQAQYCRTRLGLPSRASQMTTEFSSMLSTAYGRYYGMPSIITFSASSLQWSKKLAFIDPASQRRYTLKIGDFMMERGRQDVIRVDHILVHHYEGKHYLFVRGTRLSQLTTAPNDSVLGGGYRRLRLSTSAASTWTFVGLPAILSRPLYIIPVATGSSTAVIPAITGADELSLHSNATQARDFIWAERTLQWL